jgi:tRNA-dihydrouridine synthase
MDKPFFVLAPMDDVTDTVFRRVVETCAPADLYMTEFVNVDGLCSPGRDKLMHRLSTSQDKGRVIAQIWGKNPDNFGTIARELADGTIPGFVGVDLNFGCPEKSVVKNECCSALAQPHLRDKATKIIEATKNGITNGLKSCNSQDEFSFSIKTRLGFDKIDYSWHEFLLSFSPDILTVHVRTTKQMSKVPAQREAILPIIELRNKISPETKIVLNGDIANRGQGTELAREYGVDGIMIGRGVFQNPFCFSDKAEAIFSAMTKKERIELLKSHIMLHQKTYPNSERPFNPLKKFAKVYISDFAGASDLRDQIMHTNSTKEALEIIKRAVVN